MMVFFQNLDYSRLHPVRYRNLGHGRLSSICVSGRWLVALHGYPWRIAAHVYTLPGLQSECKLPDVLFLCDDIRADSEGRVFSGCWERVAMLEISETGNLTFSRNLTAGEGCTGD